MAAVEIANGRARVQKTQCVGCGLCVPACPTGAIRHPLYAAQALDGELSMLLERGYAGPSSRVVAMACRGGMANLMEAGHACVTYPSSILPMEVPCLLSMDRLLVLRAFEMGADGVVLLGCAGNCLFGPDLARLQEVAQTLKEELQAKDISKERLAFIADGGPSGLGKALHEYAARMTRLGALPHSN
jgi:F420-non-reducing hydrogenase iron-sulfur subunit